MKTKGRLMTLRASAAAFVLCLASATVSVHAAVLPKETVSRQIQAEENTVTGHKGDDHNGTTLTDGSMLDHIHCMKKNLKENPDPGLKKRLEKARNLYDCARQCMQYAKEAENAEKLRDEYVPAAAGISKELVNMNRPQYWYGQYRKSVKECLSLDTRSRFFHGYRNVSGIRKSIVNTALSMEGKIRYVWGGKPSSKGVDSRWEHGTGGLDCSGFVAWAYWTGTDSRDLDSSLYSTLNISACNGTSEISHDELLPGDLGMITDSGTYYTDINGNRFFSPEEAVASNKKYRDKKEKELVSKAVASAKEKYRKEKKAEKQKTAEDKNGKENSGILHSVQAAFNEKEFIHNLKIDTGININDISTHYNHVGIYVGKDTDGNEIWCHCTGGSSRTVVVNSYSKFRHFYRVNVLEDME